jgi:hypothetical protein
VFRRVYEMSSRLRTVGTACLAAVLVALPLTRVGARQDAERVDAAAVARIREEGLTRSQAMDTVFWLTDRYGPRLTGSPEFEEAGDWAVKRLQSWGVADVRKERFAFGRGWSLVRFHATMTSPRVMPMIGMPRAWTPSTRGVVTAEVVRPVITSAADATKYAGTLQGKIVLAQPARDVRMLEHGDGTVLRYDDQDGRWREEALAGDSTASAGGQSRRGGGAARGRGAATRGGDSAPAPAATGDRGAPSPATPARRGGTAATAPSPARFNLLEFYRDEGVVALFDRGSDGDLAAGGSGLGWVTQRVDGGTIVLQQGGPLAADSAAVLPQVTLAVEHYNRLVRLVDRQIPVQVELQVETRYTPETSPRGFNIVGEIPGTDKAGEIVLLGAHFDSWHGATGATDNAAGVAAVMEVLRIFRAAGLQPRRTVRIGLWGAEESGLVGSQIYVRDHLGSAANPTPGLAAHTAYFNLDNGTGRIRGIWTQGNAAARPAFEAWAGALRDLGVDIVSPRSVSQTDHVSFERVGVPAFQFVQERYEYNSRTHHTNMDTYDRVQPEDVRQMAVVAAVFAWHAATREERLTTADPGAR